MKMFVESEVHCHLFLTSTLKGGERQVSHLPALSLGKVLRNQFDESSGAPQGRFKGVGKTTIVHDGNQTIQPSS